jgi:hypothetical protein
MKSVVADPGRYDWEGDSSLRPLTFELPPSPAGRGWRRCIDTAQPSPDDVRLRDEAAVVPRNRYLVQPRSVVLLALDGQSTTWR